MVSRAQLRLEQGEAQPETYVLDQTKSALIGRQKTNQIVLGDEHASRQHAEVYFKDDCWYVRDIEALNRTQVNGKPIPGPTPLINGSRIKLGRTILLFESSDSGAVSAPWQYLSTDDEHNSSFHLKTVLLPDEFSLLWQFNSQAVKLRNRRELILLALSILQSYLPDARLGFMSLDASEAGQNVVELSEGSGQRLSEQLTREVESCRKPIWIREPGQKHKIEESLHSFSDALGLPLGVEGTPMGILHIYKLRDQFTERGVRFCELLAGNLSHCLTALRREISLSAENQRLRALVPENHVLIGSSKAMDRLRLQIERVAPRNATVLICGESGVGKELVAAALHRCGPRSAEPLVAVNAAALSPSLVESQLFGHRRGAFTDASASHRGFFEQADGGVLFLDEVGELPLDIQAKFLRVLENQEFRPVGATAPIKTDVRVVAATNRDLQKEVDAGRFRADLFYRLEIITIQVPPLREHLEDIPQLARHFLESSPENKGRKVQVDPSALQKLQKFSWPGNVRQLRTAIERALAFAEGDLLFPEDFILTRTEAKPRFTDLNLDSIIEAAVRQALEQTQGNQVQAAALLGIARDTLINRMKKYGISRDD